MLKGRLMLQLIFFNGETTVLNCHPMLYLFYAPGGERVHNMSPAFAARGLQNAAKVFPGFSCRDLAVRKVCEIGPNFPDYSTACNLFAHASP